MEIIKWILPLRIGRNGEMAKWTQPVPSIAFAFQRRRFLRHSGHPGRHWAVSGPLYSMLTAQTDPWGARGTQCVIDSSLGLIGWWATHCSPTTSVYGDRKSPHDLRGLRRRIASPSLVVPLPSLVLLFRRRRRWLLPDFCLQILWRQSGNETVLYSGIIRMKFKACVVN